MRTKICRKCGEELPATPDHSIEKRGKYGLGSYCKPCHNKTGAERKRRIKKYKTVPECCESCQRLDKKKDKCMVMMEFTENCWAWTDDKDWLRKVKKAVEEYKAGRFVRNED